MILIFPPWNQVTWSCCWFTRGQSSVTSRSADHQEESALPLCCFAVSLCSFFLQQLEQHRLFTALSSSWPCWLAEGNKNKSPRENRGFLYISFTSNIQQLTCCHLLREWKLCRGWDSWVVCVRVWWRRHQGWTVWLFSEGDLRPFAPSLPPLPGDATSPHSLPNGANYLSLRGRLSPTCFFFLFFFALLSFKFIFMFISLSLLLSSACSSSLPDSSALPRSQTDLSELFISAAPMSTWQNLQLRLLCGEKWE